MFIDTILHKVLMGKFFDRFRLDHQNFLRLKFRSQNKCSKAFNHLSIFFCQIFEDSVSIKLGNLLLRGDKKFTIIRYYAAQYFPCTVEPLLKDTLNKEHSTFNLS